jgi:hypothetical protein
MNINLEILLYAAEAICAAAGVFSGIMFIMCKDVGYLIVTVLFLAGAALSFLLTSWLPLAIGSLIAVLLLLLGSGVFMHNYGK